MLQQHLLVPGICGFSEDIHLNYWMLKAHATTKVVLHDGVQKFQLAACAGVVRQELSRKIGRCP
jgi:hypothetical protein